ncbi:MAG TPA: aldehyde dehydrogenase family protein, partial [Terrimesophilobacter sp.]|nr:aldehyde dehydrogenase family protein [Terrimesophilobacter sp.]
MAREMAHSSEIEHSSAVDTHKTFTGPDQPMWINGEPVESTTGEWRDVLNPARRGSVITRVPAAGVEDVNLAVAAAKAAFETFSRTTV